MMYVIRGTDERTGQDISIVVEAESRTEAELMGLKRGIPIVIIEQATKRDIEVAKANRLLWRSTHEEGMTAFGTPVSRLQLVSLMLCGLLTAGLIFRAENQRRSGKSYQAAAPVSAAARHR